LCVALLLGRNLLGNNTPLDVPSESILPEMYRCILPQAWRNPFSQERLEAKNEIEVVNVDLLSQYLRLKISGYLESNEPTKSYCLWEGAKILKIGDTIALKGAPGVENGAIDLYLSSIRSPFIIFKYADREFSLKVDPWAYGVSVDGEKPAYVMENVIGRGVIVHPDGWVVATNAQLEDEDNLWVYIQDIPYPVKLITTSKVYNLSLLKIFNSHYEVKLPYIPLAGKDLEIGDTIFTQEFFNQSSPYKKQVLIKKDNGSLEFKPEVEQHEGAIRLNEDFKLVGFYSEGAVLQEELQLFLGPLANVKEEDAWIREFRHKALINIVQE